MFLTWWWSNSPKPFWFAWERESQQHCQKELKAQKKKKKKLKPYGEVLTEAEVCCSDKYPAADAKCSNAMEQKQRA